MFVLLMLCIVILLAALLTGVAIYLIYKKFQTPVNAIGYIRKYLGVVYPQSNLTRRSDMDVQALWDSLVWYYLPLAGPIAAVKKPYLTTPDKDSWCMWYMACGADCGNYEANPNGGSNFICSVFTQCSSSEFDPKKGKPYQMLAYIQPFGRRDGAPNYAYLESVAFPCEYAPLCVTTPHSFSCFNPPSPTNATNAIANLPPKIRKIAHYRQEKDMQSCMTPQGCQGDDCQCTFGCTYDINVLGTPQSSTCCWNYSSNPPGPDNSVCKWPEVCAAYESKNQSYVGSNYCDVPNTLNCLADDSGSCVWQYNGQDWWTWVKGLGKSASSYWIDDLLYSTKPIVPATQQPPTPSFYSSYTGQTMFYWCPGYGKFLNYGKTAIYFNYIHLLLTCPLETPTTNYPLRYTFPQVLQISQSETLKKQLEDLTSGKKKDPRKWLEGYVVTLNDPAYTPSSGGGTSVSNKMKHAGNVLNVDGLVNPEDTEFLKAVASRTVIRYYDPTSKVTNPQYGKTIQFYPDDAIILMAAMYIYGDTQGQWYGVKYTAPRGSYMPQWPFGTYYFTAKLGSAAYSIGYQMGCDSLQLTMMPTASGIKKWCDYPAVDYETVIYKKIEVLCGGGTNGFVTLDVTKDWDNYLTYGYVQGSGNVETDVERLGVKEFSAADMPLTERNYPSCVSTPPNLTYYEAAPGVTTPARTCPYKDDLYRNQ